jgi:hypothetical protein
MDRRTRKGVTQQVLTHSFKVLSINCIYERGFIPWCLLAMASEGTDQGRAGRADSAHVLESIVVRISLLHHQLRAYSRTT